MSNDSRLTHFNESGDVHMVDIGAKAATHRVAIASGSIRMQEDTLALISKGAHKKGDVLTVARIAGITAAKKTADIIPLCHPIALTKVDVELTIDDVQCCVHCRVTAATTDRTGIEMEALNAVSGALLTVYDMCKAVDRGMEIVNIVLDEKTGGASGHYQREGA